MKAFMNLPSKTQSKTEANAKTSSANPPKTSSVGKAARTLLSATLSLGLATLVGASALVGTSAQASTSAANTNQTAYIWGKIPIVRGVDHCRILDASSATRTQHMREMVSLATQLMQAGAFGSEAIDMLERMDKMYDSIMHKAAQGLPQSLEAQLKSGLSELVRTRMPNPQKVQFIYGRDPAKLPQLTHFAYGVYEHDSRCNGHLHVRLDIVDANNNIQSFEGRGASSQALAEVSQKIFNQFHKTKLPTGYLVRGKKIEVHAGPNNFVGVTLDHLAPELYCSTLGMRLPNENEIRMFGILGPWSGGFDLGDMIWPLDNGKFYNPRTLNPSPVRNWSEINNVGTRYAYVCIRDL